MLLYFLHIKQGLMKNFVRTMDQAGLGFTYLDEKFPGISAAKKKKEGGFVGPQICQFIRDE